MSGRSAVARAKRNGDGTSSSHKRSPSVGEYHVKIVPQSSTLRQQYTHEWDLDSTSSHHNSSTNSHYGSLPKILPHTTSHYQSIFQPAAPVVRPVVRRPPIVVTSAIEKSQTRAQVDEFTDTFRNNIGKWMGIGKTRSKTTRSVSSGTPEPSTLYPTPAMTFSTASERPSTERSGLRRRFSGLVREPSSRMRSEMRRRNSLASYAETEIKVFSGAGIERSAKALSGLSTFSKSYDTVVFLRGNDTVLRPYQTFCIDSNVLRYSGCDYYLQNLTPLEEADSDDATIRQLLEADRGDNAVLDDKIQGQQEFSSTMSGAELNVPDYVPLSHALNDYKTEAVEHHRKHVRQRSKLSVSSIKSKLCIDVPAFGSHEQDTAYLLEIRNMLAVLHGKNELCGSTLYNALSGVVSKLYSNLRHVSASLDKRELLIDFLRRHKYDDVSNNFAQAHSMLAFSELSEIQWTEAYLQSFAHCASMKNAGYTSTSDWYYSSPDTQIFLHHSSRDLKDRLERAQKILITMEFPDLWLPIISAKSTGRAAFARFQQWIRYFLFDLDSGLEAAMLEGGIWLTPHRLAVFNTVFNALFDYLVDRDVVGGNHAFKDLPMAPTSNFKKTIGSVENNMEILFGSLIDNYDKTHGFPRMPHPYPLLPPAIDSLPGLKTFSRPSSDRDDLSFVKSSYHRASNSYRESPTAGSIVDPFSRFELEDDNRSMNPREARLGRWILIYGVLQILASISPKAPGLQYSTEVPYHMSVSLVGLPPWEPIEKASGEAPRHEDSHPFTAPLSWLASSPRSPAPRGSPSTFTSSTFPRVPELESDLPAPPVPPPKPSAKEFVISVRNEISIERPNTEHGPPKAQTEEATETQVSSPLLRSFQHATGNIDHRGILDRPGAVPRIGGRGGLVGGKFGQRPEESTSRIQRRSPGFVGGKSNYRPEPGW